MRRLLIPLLAAIMLVSCNSNKNIPDVSSIKVNLQTKRFEKDFFAIDTTKVAESMKSILQKYPDFLPLFTANILGLDLDSLLIPGNREDQAIRMFIHDYMPIKDSAEQLYNNFDNETHGIEQGLQFVKYYFPQYKIPQSIITFIGPIDANFETSFGVQGDVLTTKSIGIGLQLHMGKYFSFYRSTEGMEEYPNFLSNNFNKEHISVNAMRNIVDDLFPAKIKGRALIEQMVDRGRRMYLLTKFLPYTPEYLCMGYTSEQMKDALKNEAVIWDFFLNNNLLNKTDDNIIQNYIGESPKTPELGEGAPGNIGTFSGFQIVKKFMEIYPNTSLSELMKKDPREIYDKSKYKPRI
ncbi:MAG TPA: hypothetical protein VLS85_02340 [Hanamia sp.]|nr:hypothetical protein [Hanamia sp.]